jgi:hypothetical protein
MGQAKVRKQRIGSLYGTAKGSNFYVAPFMRKELVKKLPTHSPARHYLTLHPHEAADLRLSVAYATIYALGENYTRKLSYLPDEFREAFLRLLGHTLVSARQFEDWNQIACDLRAVCDGEDNQMALATWAFAPDCSVLDDAVDPRHSCYSILQKILDTAIAIDEAGSWTCNTKYSCACLASHKYMIQCAIPNHLSAAGSIASGGLVFKSGSLLLFDDSCGIIERRRDDNLWLARLRKDGIYALGPLAETGDLKPSEIKAMRQFIGSFKGGKISGRLNPGREVSAAKICRAVGMTVSGNYAFIGHD